MSKRRPFWFWNTASTRLAWLLLAVVFAAYASRGLRWHTGVGRKPSELVMRVCARWYY